MLRNHIQNIAFITFLDDIITFKKYILIQKFHACKLISKATRHNKDCILRVKAVYLSPPLSKPDPTLSSMDRDTGHTSLDIGIIGNSFVFAVVLSST
jgi:hypothetical protein